MKEFTASNGVAIHELAQGIGFTLPGRSMISNYGIGADKVAALREFFRHDADERFGRWRWSESPDYVCYGHDGSVFVMDERTGRQALLHRGHVIPGLPEHSAVAVAYFEAHPEPKPWGMAAEGDIWELDGTQYLAVIDTDGETAAGPRFFRFPLVRPAHPDWSPGRFPSEFSMGFRVWPES